MSVCKALPFCLLTWQLCVFHCASAAAVESEFQQVLTQFFDQHCVACHSEDDKAAGIGLDVVGSADELLQERKTWIKVLRMIQLGAMPPDDIDKRPAAEECAVVVEQLQNVLENFDCEQVARPGHPVIRRLNRVEYNNTIRDLFGISITPADDFPSDDVGEGFDNIGGVLSVSPLLLEKYLAAAERVTEAVLDTTDYSVPRTWVTEYSQLKASHDQTEDYQGIRFLKEPGELWLDVDLPATGKYEIELVANARPHQKDMAVVLDFDIKVDGEVVRSSTVPRTRFPRNARPKFEFTAGRHRISFEHFGAGEAGDDSEQEPSSEQDPSDVADQDFQLGIGRVAVKGPLGPSQPAWSEKHRSIVTARPGDGVTAEQAATQIVTPLLRRIFRRPATTEEVARFASLVVRLQAEHKTTWERAVAGTIQAMLVSPDFLFRVEQDPAEGQSDRLLNDHELATRLSYFLWSSMPDEELFRLADEGRLSEPDILKSQIRRMIADNRSQALVDNFAAQWLNLRNLDVVQPDGKAFPAFSDELRSAMKQETALVFRNMMRQDRSVEELLSGRTTWVNGLLAEHYGIEGVSGDEFVEVSLQHTLRRGVLTHASILTLTSYPQRTSPVQRGKWILENIFGDGPPPPPPGVPELEESAKDSLDLPLREQMAIHRTNPVCASCHQVMDPLGMGLENFDGIGHWRDDVNGRPVDAGGRLPDGREFTGPQQLVDILLSRKDDFFRTLSSKMLVYATGRGMEYYDKCVIDDCVEQMSRHDYRFSALVEAIVMSDAFRKRGQPE